MNLKDIEIIIQQIEKMNLNKYSLNLEFSDGSVINLSNVKPNQENAIGFIK